MKPCQCTDETFVGWWQSNWFFILTECWHVLPTLLGKKSLFQFTLLVLLHRLFDVWLHTSSSTPSSRPYGKGPMSLWHWRHLPHYAKCCPTEGPVSMPPNKSLVTVSWQNETFHPPPPGNQLFIRLWVILLLSVFTLTQASLLFISVRTIMIIIKKNKLFFPNGTIIHQTSAEI